MEGLNINVITPADAKPGDKLPVVAVSFNLPSLYKVSYSISTYSSVSRHYCGMCIPLMGVSQADSTLVVPPSKSSVAVLGIQAVNSFITASMAALW